MGSASSAATTSFISRCTSERWAPWASGRWKATPSGRARGCSPTIRAAAQRSRALSPWRSMLVVRSSTKRASGWRVSRSVRSSVRLTVWITRAATAGSISSPAPNGRHGVITSTLPG